MSASYGHQTVDDVCEGFDDFADLRVFIRCAVGKRESRVEVPA
jgi:hypothetical protein